MSFIRAGADSTYFLEQESTAQHLIHYAGYNATQTKVAVINANILSRFLTVVRNPEMPHPTDGETNQFHALYDTYMALDASIRALSHGMEGIVMCFNADDIGIQSNALTNILHRVNPKFEILFPIATISARDVRAARGASKLRTISCMYDDACGFCPKCTRGY